MGGTCTRKPPLLVVYRGFLRDCLWLQYGPGASYGSHMCHNDTGPMVLCLNDSAAIAYYKARLDPAVATSGFIWPGISIDEWGGNAGVHNSSALAAEGYRQARAAWPHNFVMSWVAGSMDDNLVSLLVDGTVDLAVVEGYTYCPHARHANSCSPSFDGYYKVLEKARKHGVINKTILCFGKMYAKGSPMTTGPTAKGGTDKTPHKICPWPFCGGGGWTNQTIRAAALRVKHDFPEMPGTCMYGEHGVVGLTHGDTPAQRAFEAYTSELMLELYPDHRPRQALDPRTNRATRLAAATEGGSVLHGEGRFRYTGPEEG